MAKKRISIDKERFETLKNELVRVSNIDLSSDNAYSDLCDYIKKQSNTNFPLPKYEDGSVIQQSETISIDTLRRYLGYKDWETFCHEYKQTNTDFDIEKGFNGMDYFKFSSLCKNEIICIGWYPQKYCRLKFLGEYSFEVVESYRMESKIGRKFETSGFRLAPISDKAIFPEVLIEPLYEYQEDLWNAIENFDIKNCPTEILL